MKLKLYKWNEMYDPSVPGYMLVPGDVDLSLIAERLELDAPSGLVVPGRKRYLRPGQDIPYTLRGFLTMSDHIGGKLVVPLIPDSPRELWKTWELFQRAGARYFILPARIGSCWTAALFIYRRTAVVKSGATHHLAGTDLSACEMPGTWTWSEEEI